MIRTSAPQLISFFLVLVMIMARAAFGQVGINNDGSAPNASAMLDVKSNVRGFLPPRMTQAERNAIVNPAEGLMVICTDCGADNPVAMSVYLNGAWWLLTGYCPVPDVPSAGTSVPLYDNITWVWNPVDCADEYRINESNDFTGAISTGTSTSRMETGLNCNTPYTRYVWAKNSCGHSAAAILTASTLTVNPAVPAEGTHIPAVTQVTWNWNAVTDATGYKWNTTNDYATATDLDTATSFIETGLTCNTPYTRFAWAYNNCGGHSEAGVMSQSTLNDIPASPVQGTNVSTVTQITWKWNAVTGATGYRWSATNDYATATDMGTSLSKTETGLICNTPYTRYVWAYNECTNSNPVILTQSTLTGAPTVPGAGTIAPDLTKITWSWTVSPGATGFKWNTINNIATATDLGTATMYTETGLTCGMNYTRYVWAYNTCGNSAPRTLSASTRHCGSFICGTDSLPIVHSISGGVAPVSKILNYGTVTGISGEPLKCWITRNLGASRKATSVSDASEPAAGWYWQFNRKKGYKNDGSNLTPAWTITTINESSNWVEANDPCFLELGNPWRIPTQTEWFNVDNAGHWANWDGPWNSGLKMHAAGFLYNTTGALSNRGSWADYWSSTQSDVTQGQDMNFGNTSSSVVIRDKAYGFPLRCLKDSCTGPPVAPSAGAHVPASTSITWKWNAVAGASGYRWSATNDYATATDMGTATSKSETGLTCNTTYTRYIWSFNPCGPSASTQLIQATLPGTPALPVSATHVAAENQITWKWNAASGATGYKWNTTSDYGTATDMGTATAKTETGLSCATTYTRYLWAYNSCGNTAAVVLTQATFAIPLTPTAAKIVVGSDRIIWSWNAVANAAGYKWNTTNDYATAVSLGLVTVNIETGLTCNTGYTRYVWSYNSCGNVAPLILTASTRHCGKLVCGTDSVPAAHLTASGVAPVNKIMYYGTAFNIPGEPTKCWITKNLGADSQAASVSDAAEAPAGWYWQFNRKQGFRHDGSTLTPAWTVLSIVENLQWQPANDPCTQDLGSDWRIPTTDEWYNISTGVGWSNWTGPWNSALKLHAAGYLNMANGSLGSRGSSGTFWSGNQFNPSSAAVLTFDYIGCGNTFRDKPYGYSLRCLNVYCTSVLQGPSTGVHVPSVDQVIWNWNAVTDATGYKWSATNNYATATDVGTATTYTETGLTCNTSYTRYVWAYNLCGHSAAVTLSSSTLTGNPAVPVEGTHVAAVTQVIWNWNMVTGATGYKWNTVNDYATATDLGTATTHTETGLTCNTPYTRYAWAYNTCTHSTAVTLSAGTSLCPFTCGTDSLTVNHQVSGGVAPVDKNTKYGTVKGVPGEPAKCWITKNLGADHQATAVEDASEPSAGWYWQFNRKQGRKFDPDATPLWTINSISENSDWLIANDPCQAELGGAWRIPTNTEWTNVAGAGGWTNATGPWNSALKLHYGGWVNTSGTLNNRGSAGVFWTSSQSDDSNAKDFVFTGSSFSLQTGIKPEAFPLRCLSDTICQAVPPQAPSSGIHILGDNSIFWRWNTVSCATGYKWSGSNDFATATDLDAATVKYETGLTAGTACTRYVWAYNGNGPSSVSTLTATTTAAFPCGDSLAVNHQVSGGVAPVAKTTKYGTVTNVPGEPAKCWITKNLGADRQATAVSDDTEPSAGWYWQFNLKQGYKHDGTDRIPNTTWITSINQNSDWTATQDPCKLELGTSWRIPTATEWNNVKTSGEWTNWTGPWNSLLKLHAAGDLLWNTGTLEWRGQGGDFWSVSQTAANTANWLGFNSPGCAVNNDLKTFGFTIRCLKD